MSDTVFSAPCKKVLFLDLEDTVIAPVVNGWFNTHMINVQKVRGIIEQFKPDSVHIFSFAIWNEFERNAFNLGTRPMLEKVLGVKLSSIPTVDDEIKTSACKILGINPESITFSDMSDFWGKQEAFRLNMRHMFKNNSVPVQVMFLDDAVFNEEFVWPDLNVKGHIINIDQFVGDHKIPDKLTSFSHIDWVQLQPSGELYFSFEPSGDTVKENESELLFIEEELNSLGFTLIERYVEHDCITGYIVWR